MERSIFCQVENNLWLSCIRVRKWNQLAHYERFTIKYKCRRSSRQHNWSVPTITHTEEGLCTSSTACLCWYSSYSQERTIYGSISQYACYSFQAPQLAPLFSTVFATRQQQYHRYLGWLGLVKSTPTRETRKITGYRNDTQNRERKSSHYKPADNGLQTYRTRSKINAHLSNSCALNISSRGTRNKNQEKRRKKKMPDRDTGISMEVW